MSGRSEREPLRASCCWWAAASMSIGWSRGLPAKSCVGSVSSAAIAVVRSLIVFSSLLFSSLLSSTLLYSTLLNSLSPTALLQFRMCLCDSGYPCLFILPCSRASHSSCHSCPTSDPHHCTKMDHFAPNRALSIRPSGNKPSD